MKTSQNQFKMMVEFAEQNGDPSKPAGSAAGRLNSLLQWEEITNMLNNDGKNGFGDVKSMEKWKKVWSDLKNNTKRKAARIHRATYSGLAPNTGLSELEKRILAITGTKTKDTSAEDSFLQNSNIAMTAELKTEIVDCNTNPSNRTHSDPLMEAETTSHRLSPSFLSSDDSSPSPSSHLNSESHPSHRRRSIPSRSRHRRGRYQQMNHVSWASRAFLRSDAKWRKLQMIKQQQDYEVEKERLRLREMELRLQTQWQGVISQFSSTLDKIADKFSTR